MISSIPIYIILIFVCTTFATLALLISTINKSSLESTRKKTLFIFILCLIWLGLQAIFTLKNIYNSNTNELPPKILLIGVLPNLLVIILIFIPENGRRFIENLPLTYLTSIHIIRAPIEIVLYWLYIQKALPQIMTFEGRNFDILAGMTTPIVFYIVFKMNKFSNKILLIWNILCLGLLLNIVILAILSAPTPFQAFGLNQPNVAIINFPFSWLPTFIVPVVLFAHLASIYKLLKHNS